MAGLFGTIFSTHRRRKYSRQELKSRNAVASKSKQPFFSSTLSSPLFNLSKKFSGTAAWNQIAVVVFCDTAFFNLPVVGSPTSESSPATSQAAANFLLCPSLSE